MKLNIIYARSLNRVIGKDNKIPWYIPEDMQRFKKLTKGCPVIMGRKTWESLPEQHRPLPYRKNIVLSTNPNYSVPSDVITCTDLATALDICKFTEQVWIIGGAQLYNESLSLADTIEETIVNIDCDGDTFIPALSNDWYGYKRETIFSKNNNTLVYFVTYKRLVN